MKFIDAHSHPCFGTTVFREAAKENGIRFDTHGFLGEMRSLRIEKSVAIGIDHPSNMAVKKLAENSDKVIPILGIEKSRLPFYLKIAKRELRDKTFCGIKIFLGYDNYFPYDKALYPFYRIAEKYEAPVIFHTGDTWNSPKKYIINDGIKKIFTRSRIKYAQPLPIDDVAVDYPNLKIVIAHAGNPWIEDTAEVVFRNDNCYADISGWFLNKINSYQKNIMRHKLEFLISFAGHEKIMFGTDWPLIKMEKYVKFILSSGLKNKFLKSIAYKNAERFWNL